MATTFWDDSNNLRDPFLHALQGNQELIAQGAATAAKAWLSPFGVWGRGIDLPFPKQAWKLKTDPPQIPL